MGAVLGTGTGMMLGATAVDSGRHSAPHLGTETGTEIGIAGTSTAAAEMAGMATGTGAEGRHMTGSVVAVPAHYGRGSCAVVSSGVVVVVGATAAEIGIGIGIETGIGTALVLEVVH